MVFLDCMTGIAPATQIPPIIVVCVGAQTDEEAFIAADLPGFESINIFLGVKVGASSEKAMVERLTFDDIHRRQLPISRFRRSNFSPVH